MAKQHCANLGRDYAGIEKTSLGTADFSPGGMTPQDIVGYCKALAAIGVHHAIFNMPDVHEIKPLELFGR